MAWAQATTHSGFIQLLLLLLALLGLSCQATAQQIQGSFDGVDEPSCTVYGWARDPLTTSPIQVRIYKDGDINSGTLVATFPADVLRSDLPFADQFHGFNHAFTDAEVAAFGIANGQNHTYYAYGVTLSNAVLPLFGNSKTMRCQPVQGYFDVFEQASCHIIGWARDRTTTTSIQVRFYSGGDLNTGTLMATVLADGTRNDLPFPDKNHGIDHIFTPAEIALGALADGQFHSIYGYGIAQSGLPVLLGNFPQSLRCPPASATVSVDFAVSQQVNSASGFLHGFSFGSPPASLITPLRPQYWRYANHGDEIKAAFPSATLDFVLSDWWGYPLNGWGGRGAPWLDWASWESFVSVVADQFIAGYLSGIIEIWNEPDIPEFWDGTNEQYSELYRRAYSVLRSKLGPNQPIAGPSFAFYNKAVITSFLDYCLANGCEVNSLAWHQNDDSPNAIAAFPGQVQEARSSFLQNSKYLPLKLQRIDTNEIVGPNFTHQPAGTLAHYDAFEKSGANAAAHACWLDSFGANECFNSTLDGLFTSGTFQPRSVWWTHKFYAEGVPGRVQTTVQNNQSGYGAVALASAATLPTGPPRILVGYVDLQKTLSNVAGTLQVQLTLNHLGSMPQFAAASKLTLRLERIPPTGEAALAAPVFVQQLDVNVVAGSAQLTLPALNVGDVLVISLIKQRGGQLTAQ